ncbi:FAD binding domain-containing protein [Fulvivirga sedimenti]|uniref:Xanthine dehydrogenase family protein subunit M n=1 Tax=Fulvivirga sedimenti TaxID=2879465 RepID=A0A9X1HU15_9BACT|nr:xanthine dehydrogenase family protein subunit M [Fulvivirga sedimenti]MCA6074507.1 xanthine dehydrogenase family protein subunit M [Fulvivirga sedimenti]MCA6075684.1 xanthine dehydrogenase family protein subunit M [Fulvivirga sedimenti]MCA6076812.1 xanthine dehydrogenase family protein subunit M [Fulvivirga sedimenti]
MIPASFDYSAPSTLDEALKLLNELGDEAKILAGGHSLIPMMKLRFAEPEHLVDLNNIPGLSYVRIEDDYLKIGAMTREVELEESHHVIDHFQIFKDATKLIADPQVRNFGTIGGNLAHGDAANDHPALMIALNAEVEITGLEGKRTVGIDDFFYGFYATAVQDGEILTEIRIPLPEGKYGNAYHKTERKVGDYATGGVAVQIVLDDNGVCTSAGIGLTNVNPTPLRAKRSEEALVGTTVDADAIEKAAQYASEDCNPSTDLRGDEDYKRRIIKVLTKRMITKALERAQS